MNKRIAMGFLFAAPIAAVLANGANVPQRLSATAQAGQAKRLTEADRKVTAGRILLKWGGYVEQVNGQDRRTWAASLWPSLAGADLDNLQKALRAVTYEGMRNALLGQRPDDDQVIDSLARSKARISAGGAAVSKALGSLGSDLVFTPLNPCRIVDTRVHNDRIGAGVTRDLDASNLGGTFSSQGGSDSDCGIPANPAALALSVTGLGNVGTGYLRVFPHYGTNTQGSPVPLVAVNTTATNDMIVPVCQICTQELKIYSTTSTHYAAFVTGYFMAPRATALSCFTLDGTGVSIDPGTNGQAFAPACPADYAQTGIYCSTGTYDADVSNIHPGLGCTFKNNRGDAVIATAHSRCCRVPGR